MENGWNAPVIDNPYSTTYWNDTNVDPGLINASGFVDQSKLIGGTKAPGIMDKIIGYNTVGKDGATVSNPGWGGLALGVGNLASNWIMGNKQMDFGREQLDFSKEQFQKNYAAQMDAYRRAANKRSGLLSYHQDRQDGTTDRNLADTLAQYNTGGQMLDTQGGVVADPTYGDVQASPAAVSSAFADPATKAAGQSLLLNQSAFGSLPELPGSMAEATKRRKSSTRDSNTEQQIAEQEKVKKITG